MPDGTVIPAEKSRYGMKMLMTWSFLGPSFLFIAVLA